MMKQTVPITFITSFLTSFFITSFIITVCSAHGPHRPRSPHVAVHTSGTPGVRGSGSAYEIKSEEHTHYVPKRPIPGSQGATEPILTHDRQLLHDKEYVNSNFYKFFSFIYFLLFSLKLSVAHQL